MEDTNRSEQMEGLGWYFVILTGHPIDESFLTHKGISLQTYEPELKILEGVSD